MTDDVDVGQMPYGGPLRRPPRKPSTRATSKVRKLSCQACGASFEQVGYGRDKKWCDNCYSERERIARREWQMLNRLRKGAKLPATAAFRSMVERLVEEKLVALGLLPAPKEGRDGGKVVRFDRRR